MTPVETIAMPAQAEVPCRDEEPQPEPVVVKEVPARDEWSDVRDLELIAGVER